MKDGPVILVTGGASGLGEAIVNVVKPWANVLSFDLEHGDDVRAPSGAANFVQERFGRLDILVNCAGVNLIGWLEDFTESEWDGVMGVNAKGIFMMVREMLPLLIESKGTVLNIISNASHVPMTCSAAYNASKGAAHILTLQMARELTKKYGITVFGVSPNKLSGTGMSEAIDRQVVATRGWTEEYARKYQLSALLTGEETPPGAVAEFIGFLLSDKARHKYLTGCVLPYGA